MVWVDSNPFSLISEFFKLHNSKYIYNIILKHDKTTNFYMHMLFLVIGSLFKSD
jgi:hypothetical protein